MKNLKALYLVLSLLLTFTVCFASRKKPEWVKTRPVNKFYFLGIGHATKNAKIDYEQKAKAQALNDLASEIEINIESNLQSTIIEKDGDITEDVKSEIRAATVANLEGYELVDTWEDSDEYWVYYKFSKDDYYSLKQAKLKSDMALSLDFFDKAKSKENNQNIVDALAFYVQAFSPLLPYLDQPLETEYNGKKIYLVNEIYASTTALLGNIKLTPLEKKHNAKFGQAIKNPLLLNATCMINDGAEIPAANLPLKAAFTKGDGDLLADFKTNAAGTAECKVTKIKSGEKLQIILVQLDTSRLFDMNTMPKLFQKRISQIDVPNTTFLLSVSGLSAYIRSEEINFGRPVDIPFIEPKLKSGLLEKGFTIVDDMGNADILIELQAKSRRGAELYGMFSAFVDMNITITDLKNGNELYKNTFQEIKGIQLNFENAGIKAFENAATQIQEQVIPHLATKF